MPIHLPLLSSLRELGIGTHFCAPWHPSHGLVCHPLTLAPITALACGRQLSGPGEHLPPYLSPTRNWVLLCMTSIHMQSVCVYVPSVLVINFTWYVLKIVASGCLLLRALRHNHELNRSYANIHVAWTGPNLSIPSGRWCNIWFVTTWRKLQITLTYVVHILYCQNAIIFSIML